MSTEYSHSTSRWKPLDLIPIKKRVFRVSMLCIALVLVTTLIVDALRLREWTVQIIADAVNLAFLVGLALWARKREWHWLPPFLMVFVTELSVLLTLGNTDMVVLLDLLFIIGLAIIQAFLVGIGGLHFTMFTGSAGILLIYRPQAGDFADDRLVIIVFLIGLTVILSVFTRTLQRLAGQSERQLETLLDRRDAIESRERLNLVNQLVIGLAHNINTPLGNSKVRLSLLRNRLEGENLEDVKQVESEINRINAVMQELKRLSVLESEGDAINLGPVEVKGLLREALRVRDMDHICEHTAVSGDGIVTKPLYFLQVLLVLLENAHLYGRDESGDLSVDIRLEDTGSGYRISVGDRGPGIPEKGKDEIFSPYFMLGTTGRGRGMGLSIARQICSYRLGGGITYDAGENMFVITLPPAA